MRRSFCFFLLGLAFSWAGCATTYPGGKPPTFGAGFVGLASFSEMSVFMGQELWGTIQGQPRAGANQRIDIVYSLPASDVVVEVRDREGRLLAESKASFFLSGARDESAWFAPIEPPVGPFQLYVRGKSSDGQPFRQGVRTSFVGQHIQIKLPPGLGRHPDGGSVDSKVELRNDGPDDRFEIVVEAQGAPLTTPGKQVVEIAHGQTYTHPFTLVLPASTSEQLEYARVKVGVRSLSTPVLVTSATTSFAI